MAAKKRQRAPRRQPGSGRKKLETPIGIQNAVIRSALVEGKTKTEIASEQGIDRHTVGRILSQPEVAHHIQETRSQFYEAMPKMRKRYLRIIEKGQAQHAGPLLVKAFEGLQVFIPKAERDSTLRFEDPLADRQTDELDYFIKTGGSWPTPEEREYYKAHRKWPHEEKQPA